MKPQYYELVDAMLGMALQYLEDKYGNLDDGLVSAGEHCIDVLSRLGLLEDGKIVSQAFDSDWLKEYLGNI